MNHRLYAAFFVFFSIYLISSITHSQEEKNLYTRPTEGVVLLSPSITETVDATSISFNPANLSLLDSWNLMYVGAYVQDQEHLTGHGHGFFFGFPVGPVGIGLAIEGLSPPDAIQEWQGMDSRARFSLAAAVHLNRAIALGIVYRTFWGYDMGNIHTFDLGLSIHPVNYLAVAFTISDVNAPQITYYSDERAMRKFNVGLTIRPLGTDRLSLGGEFAYLFGNDLTRTDVMAVLNAVIVNGVSIRSRFTGEGISNNDFEKGYFLDASLVLDFPFVGVGVGLYGQLYPSEKSEYQGTSWAVSIHGDEAPRITMPKAMRAAHAPVIPLENKLSSSQFTSLIEMLERMKSDKGVDMVVLRPGPGSVSLAQSWELSRRIRDLQNSGRPVLCYLTEATGPVYLACSEAKHVWINPAGGVRLAGISITSYYFRSLFDKIGVKADVVRIGEYKSAPEMFTETGPSAANVKQLNRYLDTTYDHLLSALATNRNLGTAEKARAIIELGPFTARQSITHGLVDKVVPNDLLQEEIQTVIKKPVFLNPNYGKRIYRHRRYVDSPAVAVVHIDGDIVDGESSYIPIFNIRKSGAKTLTKILRELRRDSRIRVVVLRINSPGGSALASDMIWREVMALKKEKPVIASLGSVAASGAYYIASAADEIYAEASTLTGSIGIYYGKADLSGLLGKIGVDMAVFKRGSHADMDSWFRPYTPEERKRLQQQIGEFYDLFLERIIEGRGRGLNREIVDELGQGRIWSGVDAKHHLLIDEIGGYEEALTRARNLRKVPWDIKVFHRHILKESFLMRMLGSFVSMVREPSLFETLVSTANLKPLLRSLVPFAASDPGSPMARLPFAVIEE
jgi:protease-4